MQRSIEKADLDLKCAGVYNPEAVMYDITLTWDLSNQHPLAREAMLAHVFAVKALNLFILDSGDTDEQDFDVTSQVCYLLSVCESF